MKKMLKFALGCMFALMMASEAWAAGAYSSTAVGPNIYTKGYYNYAYFPPVGPIPPGSVIGGWVNWSYSTSYVPAGLVTYLCYDSNLSDCWLLTTQSGSTTHFNGRSAGNTFVFAQGVAGSGALSPVMYGNMDQIIVNFTY